MAQTRITRYRHTVTRIVNPVTSRIAGWAPGFGIVTFRGRKTGRTYRTPINVFPRDDTYLFVLTYGSDADWVKNVVAAGECDLHTRGHDVHLVEPDLVVDQTRRLAPLPVRAIGRLIGVTEFLTMRTAP
jgi:deazaflavin-dependent oxidoreductase (nitroreductase family)